VLGLDPDPARRALAQLFGAQVADPVTEDVEAVGQSFSRGVGVDAVLITASTKSNAPVSQAARICRKRGRIVLVGVVGLELSRADFYEKELSFQVSCSYGPGRYDPAYEDNGHDYPIGFVRWTEQRNFEAVLDLMATGALQVEPLISHRFDLDRGADAMALLTSAEPSLGILLDYPQAQADETPVRKVRLNVDEGAAAPTPGTGCVGFLGAGNYASRVLMPAFAAAGAKLHTVVSGGGVSAVHFGKRFSFEQAATDAAEVYENAEIDTVVIATRHNAHAQQTLMALRAGKHVFCEKPLCLNKAELAEIEEEIAGRPQQQVLVGFNRRFAPQVVKMKGLLDGVDQPKNILITVNAGEIPEDHWTQNSEVGGRRIVGEACHFVDLARHLAGYPIAAHGVTMMGRHPAVAIRDDKVSLTLEFADGSVATILYLANGHKAFPKERVEVFAAGRVLQLDNFLKLKGWGWSGFTKMNQLKQDKGANAMVANFIRSIREGAAQPIPKEEIIEGSRVTIDLPEECR
jgi:predicted dehydrogenase